MYLLINLNLGPVVRACHYHKAFHLRPITSFFISKNENRIHRIFEITSDYSLLLSVFIMNRLYSFTIVLMCLFGHLRYAQRTHVCECGFARWIFGDCDAIMTYLWMIFWVMSMVSMMTIKLLVILRRSNGMMTS